MIILKYNSPETQNKILKIIGLQVLREIAQNVQNSDICAIMADGYLLKNNRCFAYVGLMKT